MSGIDKSCLAFVSAALEGAVVRSLEVEGMRGCSPVLYEHPVGLEPRHHDFSAGQTFVSMDNVRLFDEADSPVELEVYRLAFPLLDSVPWVELDGVLCALSAYHEAFSFEIIGGREGIDFYFCFPSRYAASSMEGVLRKISPKVRLEKADDPLHAMREAGDESFSLFELYYEPPYYFKMLDYKNSTSAPIAAFLKALSELPLGVTGALQVLFQPCSHDWAGNIKRCLDAQSALKMSRSSRSEVKDLRKPFFAVRPRIMFTFTDASLLLQPFLGALQAEGRRVRFHDLDALSGVISKSDALEMIINRQSCMTGMIMSSSELASCFFHLPDASVKALGIVINSGADLVPEALLKGIPVGTVDSGKVVVCIPASSNNLNSLRIGRSGSGKTSGIINQVLYHAERGDGVGLMDPHGDLIEEMLSCPRLAGFVERIVYFNPADEDFAISFNPFHIDDEKDIGRITSDFVNASRSLFDSWGPRLSHILTYSYLALLLLGENLASLPELLSKSARGEAMRRRVIEKTDNPEVIRFFKNEFKSYRDDAFLPILNKISSLLIDDSTRRILSGKKNKVDIGNIINEGYILLASLPVGLLGADISFQLGSMLLSQIQKAAFHRASMRPEERRPFHLFVDECYRFSESIYDGFLNETRKYGVSLHLALQNTGQLSEDAQKSFLSVNNLLVSGINIDDANRLSRALDKRVKPEELVGLGVGEVVARFGKDIIRMNSFPPVHGASDEVRKRIIEHSHKHYYTKIGNEKTREKPAGKERYYDSF